MCWFSRIPIQVVFFAEDTHTRLPFTISHWVLTEMNVEQLHSWHQHLFSRSYASWIDEVWSQRALDGQSAGCLQLLEATGIFKIFAKHVVSYVHEFYTILNYKDLI